MRTIASDEAERNLAALLERVRRGAGYTLADDRVAVARLVPAGWPDDKRELAFLALKRHVAGADTTCGPRRWRRAELYGRAKTP